MVTEGWIFFSRVQFSFLCVVMKHKPFKSQLLWIFLPFEMGWFCSSPSLHFFIHTTYPLLYYFFFMGTKLHELDLTCRRFLTVCTMSFCAALFDGSDFDWSPNWLVIFMLFPRTLNFFQLAQSHLQLNLPCLGWIHICCNHVHVCTLCNIEASIIPFCIQFEQTTT